MPPYFFVIAFREQIADDTGYEFPDDSSARREAEQIARDFVKNRTRGPWPIVTVWDEAGRTVARIATRP
jgi:hypothetical protein